MPDIKLSRLKLAGHPAEHVGWVLHDPQTRGTQGYRAEGVHTQAELQEGGECLLRHLCQRVRDPQDSPGRYLHSEEGRGT